MEKNWDVIEKVAIALFIAVLFFFLEILYMPLIVPHTDLHMVENLGMRFVPVNDPFDGHLLTHYFHYSGGYEFQHVYGFKGYPGSEMARSGGITIDVKVMRQFITNKGVSGPIVLDGSFSYTLPGHQIFCGFGSRGGFGGYCFDEEQQHQLLSLP